MSTRATCIKKTSRGNSYFTEDEALDVADEINGRIGPHEQFVVAYQCRFCGRWHVGTPQPGFEAGDRSWLKV